MRRRGRPAAAASRPPHADPRSHTPGPHRTTSRSQAVRGTVAVAVAERSVAWNEAAHRSRSCAASVGATAHRTEDEARRHSLVAHTPADFGGDAMHALGDRRRVRRQPALRRHHRLRATAPGRRRAGRARTWRAQLTPRTLGRMVIGPPVGTTPRRSCHRPAGNASGSRQRRAARCSTTGTDSTSGPAASTEATSTGPHTCRPDTAPGSIAANAPDTRSIASVGGQREAGQHQLAERRLVDEHDLRAVRHRRGGALAQRRDMARTARTATSKATLAGAPAHHRQSERDRADELPLDPHRHAPPLR